MKAPDALIYAKTHHAKYPGGKFNGPMYAGDIAGAWRLVTPAYLLSLD